MTPFTINSRIKRRIASLMLVFWLFALGAGWANACVLQARGTHVHSDSQVAAGAPTVSPGHVGVVDEHKADSTSGKAPCLKVCDDSSRSLASWQSGIDLPVLAMPPPDAMQWSAAVAALDTLESARIERPTRAGLPLRTRFSRLSL